MCDCGSESTEGNVETAVKQVYSTCDVDNTNNVPVSVLLDFINKPDSVFNFAELKDKLDPEGNNPSVSCETFTSIVMEWCHCDQLVQLNFDNKSCCDREENASFATIADYKECIKELKHKNHVLNEELLYIKNHAMDVEEHCETLQNEKEKCHQKLIEIEKNIEERLTKKDDVEYSVAAKQYKSDVCDLKKWLKNACKDIEQYKHKIEETENEKKELRDQVNMCRKRERIQMELIKELEHEIRNKEQELLEYHDNNTNLRIEFNEQQENIAHYVECNKILKDTLSELHSTTLNYERRFVYLKNILNSVTCFPSHDTPIHKVLNKIINFNPPRPLSSLVFDNINEDILNDLDISCNHNQSLVCETSLFEEMLLADQEFHRNECRQIISKQKSQIEELELALEGSEERVKKLQEEVEHMENKLTTKETDNVGLKAENLLLWQEIKVTNDLHEELAMLRQNKKNRKMGNFSRMELKLERCEASNEKLSELLSVERSISQTLKKEKQALVEEKLTVEERLQKALAFRKEWSFAYKFEANELNRLDFKGGLTQVIEALKTDMGTIEDRYKRQHANFQACLDRLSEEFTKMELKLNFDNSMDCVNHLRKLRDACMETHKVTLDYGAISHERFFFKCVNLIIHREIIPKRKFCIFLVLVVFVVMLVFCARMLNNFTNVSIYIEKSYLGLPPPT